ncbi:similar to Saccharomyces cerevisiae YPR023C EAF3 Esa1p-associated factor [Maudiozyma saulgeensis]|uniref:Chromatin modification-related protein EAF3 n=1 Tax=Maudiozyma saulgeensis TaxID=1789683 RepID=A0A1X7R0B0_9SACH|nr:similar to Saccharomyces cerevisiae YPR023C EAF3 Esa1p-associated factor [Kazachstania saulgeensis]
MLELNGKCLAFHGPLLYEAKILRIWDPKNKKIDYNEEEQDKERIKQDIESIPQDLVSDPCYFIHYQGWKATWDEWIGNARIREYNDTNIALRKQLVQDAKDAKRQQQELKKQKQKQSTPTGGINKKRSNGQESSIGKNGSNTGTGQSRSRSASAVKLSDHTGKNGTNSGNNDNSSLNPINGSSSGSTSANNGTYSQQYYNNLNRNLPKITMHIPLKLKSILVDDWEFVTKNKKLCKLPRPSTKTNDQTITGILKIYQQEVISGGMTSLVEQSLLEEYILGLKLYFNECLSKLLLYRLEKLQYAQLEEKLQLHKKQEEGSNSPIINSTPSKVDLCNVYGSIHLLRLLSILPELMSDTTMGTQSCQSIVRQTESVLLWFAVHADTLFDTSALDQDGDTYYINTSSQYEGLALGM